MGTRCLVRVYEDNEEIVCIYRQWDGGPEGMGKDIYELLKDRPVVNGISSREDKVFNGFGCLAAALVRNLKGDKVGDVYLMKPGITDVGEEFEYRISEKYSSSRREGMHPPGQPIIQVCLPEFTGGGKYKGVQHKFAGTLAEFRQWMLDECTVTFDEVTAPVKAKNKRAAKVKVVAVALPDPGIMVPH